MGAQCSSTTQGVPPSPKCQGPKQAVDAGARRAKATGPVHRSAELLTPPDPSPQAPPPMPETDLPAQVSRQSSARTILSSRAGAGCLPLGDDMSHSWVRQANSPSDRADRRDAASSTRVASQDGGYVLDGQWVELQHVDQLVSSTRLVRAGDASKLPASRCGPAEWLQHSPGEAVRVAVARAAGGQKVALLNASSAYHVGGGFESGGRHALEEAICMQSTLFESLRAFHDDVCENSKESDRYIPVDGAVLSPGVEVFRGGSDEGYPFLPATADGSAARLAAVVSVAMPNCNPRVRDAPVDAPSDQTEYHATLVQRFAAALAAAQLAEATVVVVPDVGCGVYGNDPRAVGRALSEVVRRSFPDAFAEIHLVGVPDFVTAALPNRKLAALGGA